MTKRVTIRKRPTGGQKPRPLLDRFMEKVDKNGPNGCWEWTASKLQHGYGQITVGIGEAKRNCRANRVSYGLFKGDPTGMLVCHTCDNPGCVNPDHLYLGTYQDNANDMYARGRANKDNRKGPKGYRHLSQAIAEEIRKDREVTGDSHAKIAERFGTSREQVRDIVNGIIWK